MGIQVTIQLNENPVNEAAEVLKKMAEILEEVNGGKENKGINAALPETQNAKPSPAPVISGQIAQSLQMSVPEMMGQAAPVPVSAPTQEASNAGSVAPTPPPAAVTPAVPSVPRTYTLDELASAAMLLMDRGMQTQLQELLATYGVEALPMLPPEQYGNFATGLREMGAQI